MNEHPTMSFAGTISWDEPRLRWYVIEYAQPAAPRRRFPEAAAV